MEANGLGDLVPDRAHGVQRVHGSLEDERQASPAERTERGPVETDQIHAVEPHRAADDHAAGREQAHEAEHRRRLAATRLPRPVRASRRAGGRSSRRRPRAAAREVR